MKQFNAKKRVVTCQRTLFFEKQLDIIRQNKPNEKSIQFNAKNKKIVVISMNFFFRSNQQAKLTNLTSNRIKVMQKICSHIPMKGAQR